MADEHYYGMGGAEHCSGAGEGAEHCYRAGGDAEHYCGRGGAEHCSGASDGAEHFEEQERGCSALLGTTGVGAKNCCRVGAGVLNIVVERVGFGEFSLSASTLVLLSPAARLLQDSCDWMICSSSQGKGRSGE